MTAITEPGVYTLPDEVYHADPVPGGSLNASGAVQLLNCPARYRYERTHGREVKRVWEIGHAAHRLVLGTGPELERVDADSWRTKAAKEAAAEARDRGAVPLLPGEWQQVHDMAAEIRRNELASALLDPARVLTEQSLFWTDPVTGIWCRARIDAMPREVQSGQRMLLADYKTAAEADLDSVERAISRWRYDLRAAWYAGAVRELGLADEVAFLLVVQEKTPPYPITVVEIDAAAMRIGAALSRRAIDTYVECTRTGHWPGYVEGVALAGLPAWEQSRLEAELEIP